MGIGHTYCTKPGSEWNGKLLPLVGRCAEWEKASVNEDATRYPLSWPTGWKRTPGHQRQRARFQSGGAALTVHKAITRLSGEVARLGARDEILSTNMQTRLDGLPYSGQSEPTDPGVAVYFTLKGQARCLACDAWTRTADNIAAIAQHIDALRRIDRYGVGTLDQAFAGYAPRLQAAPSEWNIVLGVSRSASRAGIEEAFTRLAKTAHPDSGGSHDAMARLTEAKTAALREVAS